MKRVFEHPPEKLTGKRYWRSLGELSDTPEFRGWLEREFPAGAAQLEGDEWSRRGFLRLMGASMALAGFGLTSCRRPEAHLVPFTKSAEWVIPGKFLYYATAMPRRSGAIPLVVATVDGRPIKIEGNPNHPESNGATDAFAQASILDLYDPSRSQRFVRQNKLSDRASFEKYLAELSQASEKVARAAHERLTREIKGLDGVFAFPHPFGCSQLGDDLMHTQKVLAGLIRHPNAAAVLILGLGCENNQMKLLLEQVGKYDGDRVKYFNAQDVGDEIETGISVVAGLAEYASQYKRETIDARELILGMKCGGSDGLSGITANPLVGRVADRLSSAGGTAILTEVPEMFGAEQVLLDRCDSKDVFDNTIRLVNRFRDYFRRYNQPIDENPSPGNKDGGITTLAEKSLGCVQKGGAAPIVDVLEYGEQAKPGLGGVALLNSPGNDGVSSTAMTVSGAHMLLFTTGRGTPLGLPIPTIKISSNTPLQQRKPSWIDFNAGALIDGGVTPDELADKLFDFCLNVASGTQQTRNEINGNREIAIWKDGVTL